MRPFLALVALAAVAACSSDSNDNTPIPGSDVEIVSGASGMGANAFDPNPFTISLATQATVKWANADGTAHTVTDDGGGATFNSGNLGTGGTFSHTFTVPGNYPYHCSIHPTMVGTIVVNP